MIFTGSTLVSTYTTNWKKTDKKNSFNKTKVRFLKNLMGF